MNILIKSLIVAFLFTFIPNHTFANLSETLPSFENKNEAAIQELAKTQEMVDLARVVEMPPVEAVRALFQVKEIADDMLANFYLARQMQDPRKAAQTVLDTRTKLTEIRKKFKNEDALRFMFNEYVEASTGENVDLYKAIMEANP